jgi:hypothetical protein
MRGNLFFLTYSRSFRLEYLFLYEMYAIFVHAGNPGL